MKNTPNIICNIKAHQYYEFEPSKDKCKDDTDYEIKMGRYKKSKFYRCSQDFDVIKYLERPEAIEKSDQTQLENILEIEEMKSSKNTSDIFSYTKDRPGSTGVFNKDGDISSNKEIREKLRTTKSTIWSGVVSFTESYAKQFCHTKKDAEKLMRETLDTLFISQGLEPSNVSYFCAFHTNKGANVFHPHIHFIYWENEPTKLNCKGQPSYSKFMIPKKALYDFKYQIAKYHQSLGKTIGSEFMFSLRDGIKDSFKARNINELQYERWMQLDKDLGDKRSTQFARLNKAQREYIRKFIYDEVNFNPILKEKWDQYMNELNKKFLEIKKLHKENNIPLSKSAKNYCKSRIDDLYNRCGNIILKSLSKICVARKEFEDSSNSYTQKNKNKDNLLGKVKSNNPVLQQRNYQSKKVLTKFLSRLITEQHSEMINSISDELNKFYHELKERGEITIYE